METNLQWQTSPARTGLAGAGLARFLELRGHRIVEFSGALWYSVSGRFYMSLPYQLPLDPDAGEVDGMLRRLGAIGVRFPSLRRPGLPSGLYVLRRKQYDIRCVHLKHRPRVRRGLDRFEIRRADESELLAQGLQLNLDTMKRQGRYDPEFGNYKRWKRLVEAVGRSEAVVPIGAFSGGRMAAYLLTCRGDGWLHILHQMSRQEDLKDFPNHALTYSVTKDAAEDPALDAVCYGYIPLVSIEGLHEYKLRFGYEVVPCDSAFQLHPMLTPLLGSRPVTGLVRVLRRLRPNDQRLERVETVLRGARSSK